MNRINYSNESSLITAFREQAVLHTSCSLSGDYRHGNQAADKLFKIRAYAIENHELLTKIVDLYLHDDNIGVCGWAAMFALVGNYRIADAELRLQDISEKKSILSFSAEMTLKVWRGEIPDRHL